VLVLVLVLSGQATMPGMVSRSDDPKGALDCEHSLRPESAKVIAMQVWLKLLLVWFVAIALPVQGLAGVTMAHCGSSHERMGAAMDAAHDAAAVHHHDADAADVSTQADHDTATLAKAQPDQLSDLAQYKCSSCASCCAGSALLPAMPRLPQVKAAPAVFAEKLVTVDAFASDGPDRPPRTHLV